MSYTTQSLYEDIGKKFVESLESELEVIHKISDTEVPIRITLRDKKDFRDAKECYACGKKIDNDEEKKVRDHCHLTGKYCGYEFQSSSPCYSTTWKVTTPTCSLNVWGTI